MTVRKLLPVLAASFVLTLGGAVMADTTVSEAIQGMDFDTDSGVLVGYYATPNGRALGFFQHTDGTNHGIGNPGAKQHPPSPCFGLTHAWNQSVLRGDGASNRSTLLHQLASKQCFFDTDVTIDNSDASNPKYILKSITPNQP